ncbi:MAG TPA: hypothetical protein VFY06_09720 [Verrucomicrobiae bacterium]|nr:hypothetical protein [Verrucomicrobiae bacterium]
MMILAAGPLLAAPKDDVKAAATALGDAANYTWQTTVDMGANSPFQPGPTDGKTEKGGYTTVSMSMMNNTSQVVLKGTNVAVQTQDGWQTAAEATQGGGGGGGFGGGGGGGFGGGMFAIRQAENLQLPAVEATNLAALSSDLKVDGDKITGDLTEDGAKSLMSFGGRGRRGGGGFGGGGGPEITNPKGTVTFWLTDGKLTKYQFHVTGSMDFNGNSFDMDRTTTTTIKDVGSTKVDVPDEAKKKLE